MQFLIVVIFQSYGSLAVFLNPPYVFSLKGTQGARTATWHVHSRGSPCQRRAPTERGWSAFENNKSWDTIMLRDQTCMVLCSDWSWCMNSSKGFFFPKCWSWPCRWRSTMWWTAHSDSGRGRPCVWPNLDSSLRPIHGLISRQLRHSKSDPQFNPPEHAMMARLWVWAGGWWRIVCMHGVSRSRLLKWNTLHSNTTPLYYGSGGGGYWSISRLLLLCIMCIIPVF